MELREFAERVLFATTLDEKLQSPEEITDCQPGTAILAPKAPGRPPSLRFKPHGMGKADFPGVHQLNNPFERGRLLHFFANHELLATELMALVLLRFPEAPAAFRKGVLQTLKDEQEHTRLYLARMKACGIEFGELPVSGYFWRCVAPMQNPIDYVAGLCLTFEQANLDFARHFGRSFAAVGDTGTAQLLERIYRDEIGHVAYGLKWFRRWKNPNEGDWEAFCRTLKFPLSPQRAKGLTVNVEGRRAAGLDPQFIAELDVFSQSKGRTPGVFVFNPFTEGYIAEGRAFNPTKPQSQLARDLANLPQFLCREDDIVIVEKRPTVGFLSSIRQAGFTLPEFIERNGHGLNNLAGRKLGRLLPWAWGPDSMDLFSPLFGGVTAEKRTPEQRFNSRIAELYSKTWSAGFLRKLLVSRSAESWLCSQNEVGTTVSTPSDVLAAIAAIRGRGHQKIIMKEAIGLAGANAMRFFEPALLETQRRWITSVLAKGHQLIVEPWLDRELDFSIQLEMTPEGLKLCGFTGLLTDARGQFRGNWAESHHHKRIPARIPALFREPADISARILRLYNEIFSSLEEELRRVDFVGPVGIDAFVYRRREGDCGLKPVVEINPRYTMGRLMVELMKHACPGSHGLFRLVNRRMLEKDFKTFAGYSRWLAAHHPLCLGGEPVPKIREGALCLNDPAEAQYCLAVFQVDHSLDALLRDVFPSNSC